MTTRHLIKKRSMWREGTGWVKGGPVEGAKPGGCAQRWGGKKEVSALHNERKLGVWRGKEAV